MSLAGLSTRDVQPSSHRLSKRPERPTNLYGRNKSESPAPGHRNLSTDPYYQSEEEQAEIQKLEKELLDKSGIINTGTDIIHATKDDFLREGSLGSGTCGVVIKVVHKSRKDLVMAVKQMHIFSNYANENKRIMRDLDVITKCGECPNIVHCMGIFFSKSEVWVCMEVMSTCLDKLLKRLQQPYPEHVVGKVAVSMIKALDYLKVHHQTMHRDIKPSNMLLSHNGEVKLCDFGVSGQLKESIAISNQLGCVGYMSPERLLKHNYDVRADVWSLGISLIELATGHFPYVGAHAEIALVNKILKDPPPQLPEVGNFSASFRTFINLCLTGKQSERPKYPALMQTAFFLKYDVEPHHVGEWYTACLQELERKRVEETGFLFGDSVTPPLISPASTVTPSSDVICPFASYELLNLLSDGGHTGSSSSRTSINSQGSTFPGARNVESHLPASFDLNHSFGVYSRQFPKSNGAQTTKSLTATTVKNQPNPSGSEQVILRAVRGHQSPDSSRRNAIYGCPLLIGTRTVPVLTGKFESQPKQCLHTTHKSTSLHARAAGLSASLTPPPAQRVSDILLKSGCAPQSTFSSDSSSIFYNRSPELLYTSNGSINSPTQTPRSASASGIKLRRTQACRLPTRPYDVQVATTGDRPVFDFVKSGKNSPSLARPGDTPEGKSNVEPQHYHHEYFWYSHPQPPPLDFRSPGSGGIVGSPLALREDAPLTTQGHSPKMPADCSKSPFLSRSHRRGPLVDGEPISDRGRSDGSENCLPPASVRTAGPALPPRDNTSLCGQKQSKMAVDTANNHSHRLHPPVGSEPVTSQFGSNGRGGIFGFHLGHHQQRIHTNRSSSQPAALRNKFS